MGLTYTRNRILIDSQTEMNPHRIPAYCPNKRDVYRKEKSMQCQLRIESNTGNTRFLTFHFVRSK